MTVTITPTKLSGSITPPPSKSQAHRLLIAAYLAGGAERVSNVADSQDIAVTRACMEALLAPGEGLPRLDCGESGSTLRFLIPMALALRGGGVFTGHGRLMERPQAPYFENFREKGIFYEQKDGVLTVRGELTPGVYTLPGNVSSQFITGLLYALPLLDGDSEICLTTRLESMGYVYLTINVLQAFGLRVSFDGTRFQLSGGQRYTPCDCVVEADWSQAGFWYAAAGIGNPVTVTGMNPKSYQGDRAIEGLMWQFEGPPAGRSIDMSYIPDLAPPLAALAALREGSTYLENAARLRIKESDRLSSITQVLTALGADVEEGEDRLVIRGRENLPGGVTVDSHNDHRIAMMAAIAATRCAEPVTLTGAECVAKSYPNFWDDYAALGGKFEVNQ